MVHMASVLQHLPDSEILQECSTSPSAEAPDFVYNQRRLKNFEECLGYLFADTAFEFFPLQNVVCNCTMNYFLTEESFVCCCRQWDYLIQHPNWNETFVTGKARVFKRVSGGGWAMVE